MSTDATAPEDAVRAFLTALAGKNKDALANLISSRATGDLAKIRSGEGDERTISRLAEQYGALKVIRVNPGSKGDERVVVLGEEQESKKTRKQLFLRKENGDWKVLTLK